MKLVSRFMSFIAVTLLIGSTVTAGSQSAIQASDDLDIVLAKKYALQDLELERTTAIKEKLLQAQLGGPFKALSIV